MCETREGPKQRSWVYARDLSWGHWAWEQGQTSPTALAKREEGCSPRIRIMQIPLPAWYSPHAHHVQGIRWPDPTHGHTTASSSPQPANPREKKKKPSIQKGKWKGSLPREAAAAAWHEP